MMDGEGGDCGKVNWYYVKFFRSIDVTPSFSKGENKSQLIDIVFQLHQTMF